MADIQKPDMSKQWANSGNKTPPADSLINSGWVAGQIPLESDFNYIDARQDQGLAYILQKGIPEWDSSTEYWANKSYVQYSGKVYKCIQTGTNKQPDAQPAYWQYEQGVSPSRVITSFDGTGVADSSLIIFSGRDTVGDGGGGYLRFLSGSTATANGITIYAVTGGRLVREGWTVFGVNVKWAGAKGDGTTDDTAAIQAAIDISPFNLIFPEGVYCVTSLQYYWGDAGSQATRVWAGNGAIIKGISATAKDYLLDISGQKLRVENLEFHGKGTFDSTYACLLRFHTRSNSVNLNDIHVDGVTLRFNNKAIIYGLPTDTVALVSEVFFNNVTIKQVQRCVDVQGVGMVDSLWNGCYLTTSALPGPGNLDENYLFKINRGSHNLVGCEVMQTDLNAGQIPGWTVLFPSTANKATWNMTGGILEVKSGFSWKDGADGGVAICNNTNGYWGYVHSDPLFKVGTGCTGGIKLSNAKLLHDATNFQTDYGPLIVDSANSPEFRVYIDENTVISPDDSQPLDLMTKIIGGKWNYPESQIAMAYGNDTVTVTAGNMLPVDFTTSWVDSAYTNNRLKGIYSNGVITIPAEGLQGAWIEVLVDWDQVASKCYLVRRTSALCSVTSGSDYVQLVDRQNPGNFFPLTYQLGITPTAKVTGTGATAGMTVSSAFFDSTNFRLSSAWAGSTGNVALTFEMKIGEITKGELRRYDLGDFRPGDQFFLGLEAVSATTSTTLPYQRVRLVAKSRLNAMKVNGNN